MKKINKLEKNEWHLPLLKSMLLSRAADKRQAILVRQGKAHLHISSAGHEPLMALSHQLLPGDYLYPYYRDSHLITGKGLTHEAIAKDFFAKKMSSSQGRSAPVHCSSRALNIYPGTAPTGAQCLPAVGTAWGQKMEGKNFITVCSIGDGAIREGEFYEAVCFSVERQLPIIFLVQDNKYAISTMTESMNPLRLAIFNENLVNRIKKNDVFSIYDAATDLINNARKGKPKILWCEVDRLDSHTVSEDHTSYRTKEEIANMLDPISVYKDRLIALGEITQEEFVEMEKAAKIEIAAIYKSAEQEPDPSVNTIYQHLYASQVEHDPLPELTGDTSITMVEGVNKILDLGLKMNSKIIMFGQDIEDPKGGVFGFTKRLSGKYPGRVINAPISEATIIGSAVGLSVMGFKPVFEIQFIDFITPGFDQLVTQVSSLRWRSAGEWSCPLVLYAPYGAYLPSGGLWHSQSNDGWWAHIPGLRVAIPSTAQDVLELFWAAFQDNDPSLILIPKHIFRKRTQVSTTEFIPFGHAKIRRAGEDVTVVAWGNTVELAEQAAEIISKEKISVEVIDLRTLVPCDWKSIECSLAKTGRLVVVHEDNRTGGFGASLISEMMTRPHCFEYLYSSPQLVARNDIHIPFHPKLEYEVLPDVQSIIDAINLTLEK